MDIQRTMEFILESQAKAEVRADRAHERADRAEERADRAEERADRADARMDRLETQVKATANLVRQGMKIIQSLARDQKETRQELRALAVEVRDLAKAQARTEATLERYIRFRSNGQNGGKPNGRPKQ